MSNIVGTVKHNSKNRRLKYSSSGTKTANLAFDGRSASIFRISTNYCISP